MSGRGAITARDLSPSQDAVLRAQNARPDGPLSAGEDRPLAIDLYTGLHGWAEGLIAAGWRVVGWKKPNTSSGSSARKAASAKIAKIPFTLAHWIGRAWLPLEAAA